MSSSAVSCAVCGTTVEAPPPLTWSTSSGRRGASWVCDACTRTHLRSMEANIEEELW